MNKKYKVEWAAVAEVDLKQIIDYVAADSPGNALQILKTIRQKTSSLYMFPERGRIVPELQGQGINIYRELIVAPWRIVYRISDVTVFVLTVIDSRQNVEDILLNRSLNRSSQIDPVVPVIRRSGPAASVRPLFEPVSLAVSLPFRSP